jgi:DNA helicase II / ATP-dependent DNA helicase PcrA
MSQFQPRPGQDQVLSYTHGYMAISAVPGSGKTRTLAHLAANLVHGAIPQNQAEDPSAEVLVVTLVNSAVENFRQHINAAIRGYGLLAGFGYRVRTLHGLAHDIVRERPGLVGLSEDFGIIDEREAQAVRDDAVASWLQSHPGAAEPYLSSALEGDQALRASGQPWTLLARDIASAFIKRAKDRRLAPEVLGARLRDVSTAAVVPSLPLARMGIEIYADYQRSLSYRGVVDFDDLIRLALLALEHDEEYLARLRNRWPYILEDEAQDSSLLQEAILSALAGPEGNWVRVGDPNQAIYETFTTASPQHFLHFVGDQERVTAYQLPQSGRCQPAIIDLANYLIDWVQAEHPLPAARLALTPPHIEPTSPGDPQPNPPLDRSGVRLIDREFTPQQELAAVVDSLARWLPGHDKQTVAVLVPRNARGMQVVDLLKKQGIPYVELLRSSMATRQTAGALGNVLRCLADPGSSRRLSVAFRVWVDDAAGQCQEPSQVVVAASRLAGCAAVEAYLWPRADHDWLAPLLDELPPEEGALLLAFRDAACRWHRAAILPIDQLVLTLAGGLFQEPAELALAYKLALLLRAVAESHPTYRLPEFVEELAVIARNERRFLGFAAEDTSFEPPPGTVTVTTMHKAKGLEWDRVYLMSVNNYDFPSGQEYDSYIPEKWFVRDSLNLEAEALAQLDVLALAHPADWPEGQPDWSLVRYREGQATRKARHDYVAERLRLLYVGITRARRDLIVTWNTGRTTSRAQPALPFLALHSYGVPQDSRE